MSLKTVTSAPGLIQWLLSLYWHLQIQKRPNAAIISLLYCLWVSPVEINSCSESGTCVKCDLFLAEGGCFSTPSFHPETKTGCDPPSASGPGSVKETLHRQGSCIDVQVLIYLLCNHKRVCCVVLCCVWPKRCCDAQFFHFSQTPWHNFTPRSQVHSPIYATSFIFTRIRFCLIVFYSSQLETNTTAAIWGHVWVIPRSLTDEPSSRPLWGGNSMHDGIRRGAFG